jgi:hypothetical protein
MSQPGALVRLFGRRHVSIFRQGTFLAEIGLLVLADLGVTQTPGSYDDKHDSNQHKEGGESNDPRFE